MQSPILVSLARVAVLAASFATAPIVARDLGPAGRGLYAAFIGVLGLTPVLFGLGMPLVVRLRAATGDASPTLKTLVQLIPFISVVAAASGAVLSVSYFVGTSDQEKALFIVAIMMSTLFIYTLCAQSVLISHRRFASIATLQCIQGLTIAAVTVSVWFFARITLSWLLLGYSIGTVISFLTALTLVRVRMNIRGAPVFPLVRQSSRFVASQLSETAGSALPLVLAIAAIGATQAGFFSVALTLATVPIAFGYALGSVTFSKVATTSGMVRDQVVKASLKASVFWGIFAAGGIALAMPFIVPTLFGPAFSSAVPAALVSALSSWMIVVNYVGTQILAAEGRAGIMTVLQFAGVCTSVAALFVIGHFLGAVGAAIGVSLGWFVVTVGVILSCRQNLGVALIGRKDIKNSYRMLYRGDFTD